MALSPRLYLDFGSLALRVAIGINSKALGLIPACSLVEEPDVGTSVSCDITHLGGPLDPSIPRLRRLPGRVGGRGQPTGRDAVTPNPNTARGVGGTTGTSPSRLYLAGVFGLLRVCDPPPRPGRQRPAPSRPRHVTRHAPAARGLHQNKNRGGGTGGGARARSLATAARPPRSRASARPGAGGQRAPPCLPPGSGPKPETVSRERARECAPTPRRGPAWAVSEGHGGCVSPPSRLLLRTSPPLPPSLQLESCCGPLTWPPPP